MTVLEFVIEVTLAVAALVIAILQWKEERRISKEEKNENVLRAKEKSIVNEIVNQIDEIEKCSDYILSFAEKMAELSRKKDTSPDVAIKLFDDLIEQYTEHFNNIAPRFNLLYIELLKNEERFPMSYGYNRYIVEIREILDLDAVERERRINNYDACRIRFHEILVNAWENGGYLSPETRLELGQLAEKMIRALEPYFRHAQKINTVLFELSVKYKR